MIDAKSVAELRAKTGAGMMDCKKALTETNGNMEAAIDYLREKGIAKAAKKESRIAAEGLANVYIKGNKAVILEVNSETDFVSKNEEFTKMIDTIGNAILNSTATTLEEVLNLNTEEGTVNDLIVAKTAKIGEKLSLRRIEVVEKEDNETFGSYLHMGGKIAVLTLLEGANEEVAIQKELAMNEGKPADIAEKMVEGRIKKFFKEICLIHQAFIKNGDIDVKTYVANAGGKVVKMIRYEVGEGMEKRSDNFAEEVMNQLK